MTTFSDIETMLSPEAATVWATKTAGQKAELLTIAEACGIGAAVRMAEGIAGRPTDYSDPIVGWQNAQGKDPAGRGDAAGV